MQDCGISSALAMQISISLLEAIDFEAIILYTSN